MALGLDLEPQTLLCAYSLGLFPWFNPGDPILWWSLIPRCVLFPDNLQISSRSRRAIAASKFSFSINRCFEEVIKACARPRKEEAGTWLGSDMIAAYIRLNKLGYAHSLETWREGELVGGLYGVALGKMFFGESMFHACTEASRAALAELTRVLKKSGFMAIDCQQATPHMLKMGASQLSQSQFKALLATALSFSSNRINENSRLSPWQPWRPGDNYRQDSQISLP